MLLINIFTFESILTGYFLIFWGDISVQVFFSLLDLSFDRCIQHILILITLHSLPHFRQTLPKHKFITFLSFFVRIYFYMYKYFTCVYVCKTHACLLPTEDRGWYWSPGTGVTYGPEMSFMWQKLNLGPRLNITYSVCIMLFVHIFTELSIWHGTTNWYICSCLGKTTTPALSILQFPIVLCTGL